MWIIRKNRPKYVVLTCDAYREMEEAATVARVEASEEDLRAGRRGVQEFRARGVKGSSRGAQGACARGAGRLQEFRARGAGGCAVILSALQEFARGRTFLRKAVRFSP